MTYHGRFGKKILYVALMVLGQVPTVDNFPPDKNKAQLLPTRRYYLETDPDPMAMVESSNLSTSPADRRHISNHVVPICLAGLVGE